MGKFVKEEVYEDLAAKELPGARISRCNQLHEKGLVLGENCESAFDGPFSEHKSKILNGARSFYKASSRRLIKKFPHEHVWRCCKVVRLWELFECLARN